MPRLGRKGSGIESGLQLSSPRNHQMISFWAKLEQSTADVKVDFQGNVVEVLVYGVLLVTGRTGLVALGLPLLCVLLLSLRLLILHIRGSVYILVD